MKKNSENIKQALRFNEEERELLESKSDIDRSLSEIPRKQIRFIVNRIMITACDYKYDYCVLFQNKQIENDRGICMRARQWDQKLIQTLSENGQYRFKIIPVQKRYPWQM